MIGPTRPRRPAASLACALALLLSACGGGKPIRIGVAANFGDPLSAPILHAAQYSRRLRLHNRGRNSAPQIMTLASLSSSMPGATWRFYALPMS